MQGFHHGLLNLCAVEETKELRICWENDDELRITIHGADVKLQWEDAWKDKFKNGWNKYCFVVRSKSGGFIKVKCQIFACSCYLRINLF